MKKFIVAIILSTLLNSTLLLSWTQAATQTFEITRNNLLDATRFSLKLSLHGASIRIVRSDNEDTIVRAEISYNEKLMKPLFKTRSSGNTFIATFKSGFRILPYNNTNIEEWTVTIGNYDIDTDLTIICDRTTADINLGGLPLTTCTLRLYTGNINVDFPVPTTRSIDKLTITGGGMNLAVSNIGNTDFQVFNLAGLTGSTTLDFNGSYSSPEHNVRLITVGMVNNILLPSGQSGVGAKVRNLFLSPPITVMVPVTEWNRNLVLPSFVQYSTNDYTIQNTKIDLGITTFLSFVTIVREE